MLKDMMKICALASPLALASGAEAKAVSAFKEDPFFKTFINFPTAQMSAVDTSLVKTKDGYVLKVALPGFTKSEVKINLERDNILRVTAARKVEENQEGEVVFGNMSLAQDVDETFQLGHKIDPNTIKASMENGILTIQMKEDPKQVTTKEIQIS